ncbi:MAG: hypothetical protein IT374_00195, partial [Polyangiaceae bacterium]|nr:hypothetical protein [Polyangiaceae bacterium]
ATSGGASGATSGGASGATSGGASGATSGGASGATSGGASGATSGGSAGASAGNGGAGGDTSGAGGASAGNGGAGGDTSGAGGTGNGGSGQAGAAGSGGGANLCCAADTECDAQSPGTVCVLGYCKKPAPSGECWDDGDCPKPGTHCDGEIACDCSLDIVCPPKERPGTCVQGGGNGACCKSDNDCEKGFECAGPLGKSVCLPTPPKGECWSNADCGGGICEKATICPCGANCLLPNSPGKCL